MRTRWQVKLNRKWPYMWVVSPPEGHVRTFSTPLIFDTHAKALAYADRMARTITVTLPRVDSLTFIPSKFDAPDEPPTRVSKPSRMTLIGDGDMRTAILDYDQLEPVALTLLALARRCA